MIKMMIGKVLAVAIALIPVLGMTSEQDPMTPAKIAAAAVEKADRAVQKGLVIIAETRKASDQAQASVDKAQAVLKLVEASGEKEKIKLALVSLQKAKSEAAEVAVKLAKEIGLVDRLRVILEKVQVTAAKVAGAKTRDDATAAAKEADLLAAKSGRIMEVIVEVMKQRQPVVIITVPVHTTSTTHPSPTPVGRRG